MIISLNNYIYSQEKYPDALSLTLRLEKYNYMVDEPIYYELAEKNVSDRIISTSPMRPSAIYWFKIILTNSRGDTLLYKGGQGFFNIVRDKHGVILQPGETIYDVRNLLGIFGENDESHGITLYLPPHKYKIKIIHYTNTHWPLEFNEAMATTKGDYNQAINIIDKMAIESNEVEFEVVEPQGEEKRVQAKLLNAYNILQQIAGREPIEIIPILNEIVDNYPNSVYAKPAYYQMKLFLSPSSRSQTRWDEDKILRKYSNSFFIYPIIEMKGVAYTKNALELLPNDYDVAYTKNALESLVKDYPNTKLEEYTYNIISRYKIIENK